MLDSSSFMPDVTAIIKDSITQLLAQACQPGHVHRTVRAVERLVDDYARCADTEAFMRAQEAEAAIQVKALKDGMQLRQELSEERRDKRKCVLHMLLQTLTLQCELRRDLFETTFLDHTVVERILSKHHEGVKRMWEGVVGEQSTEEGKDALRRSLVDCAQDLLDDCRDGLVTAALPLQLILELGSQIGVTCDDVGTTQPEIKGFLDQAEET